MSKWLKNIGKAIEKAVQDTGKTIEKAAHDTGKTIEKAAHDTGKTIEKAAHDVGEFVSGTGEEIGDFGRNFDRERLKGTENVFRELKVGYCRLIEGRSPEEGNDKNQNQIDDDFERCMADQNNFSITVSGDLDGNITDVQTPIGTTTGQKGSINIATDAERAQVEAARLAEQKYIEAFNEKVVEHFQPMPDVASRFFREVSSMELRPQGTTTALILNDSLTGGEYQAPWGEVFESKAAFLERITLDQIADHEAMIAEIRGFDLSRGRLQLSEAVLAFKGAFTLPLDILAGSLSVGKQAMLVTIGVIDDVVGGNGVSFGMLARKGKVPFYDTFMTFSALSVIQSDYNEAKSEKRRVERRLQDEISLLQERLKEIRDNK